MFNNSVIRPSSFEIRFNSAVENIKAIIREGRHNPAISNSVKSAMFKNYLGKLDDANFSISFCKNVVCQELLVRPMLLDMMDALKDGIESGNFAHQEMTMFNSIYDVINEFYFEEV